MEQTAAMSGRRLRTAKRKQRAREQFWNRNGERVRLGLIGASVVLVSFMILKLVLGGQP